MKGWLLTFALLCTGVSPAQDLEIADTGELEGVGTTCTALAVFATARHESYFGQALVAQVVLNQQSRLPLGADACDVIMQRGQFPAIDAWAFPRDPWGDDPGAWRRAVEIAEVVAAGDYYIPPPCHAATAFRAVAAEAPPGHAEVCEVGALRFYVPAEALQLVATATTGPAL